MAETKQVEKTAQQLDRGDPRQQKYGYQLLKKSYDDHAGLLLDHHGHLSLVDHEPTNKLFDRHLAYLDKYLSKLAEHAKNHYSDHPPLDEEEEDDVTDNGDPRSARGQDSDDESGQEILPTEEEVVAAMAQSANNSEETRLRKGFGAARIKSGDFLPVIKGKIDGTSPYAFKHPRDAAAYGMKRFASAQKAFNWYKAFTKDEDEEKKERKKKEEASKEKEEKALFKDHELAFVKGAHSFLKTLSETKDFGDTERKEAYAWSKMIDTIDGVQLKEDEGQEIGTKGDDDYGMSASDVDRPHVDDLRVGARRGEVAGSSANEGRHYGEQGKPISEAAYRRLPKDPGPTHTGRERGFQYLNLPQSHFRAGGKIPPESLDASKPIDTATFYNAASGDKKELYHHVIGEASKFLKAVSDEKAFGERHREEAAEFHKALDPVCCMGGDANVQRGNGSKGVYTHADAPLSDPSRGQTKSLEQRLDERDKFLGDLLKEVEGMKSLLPAIS